MSLAFQAFKFAHGLLNEFNTDGYATSLYAWQNEKLDLPAGATYYGYVYDGNATLSCESGEFCLKKGMFFAVPAEASIIGSGSGIVISRPGYKGLFQMGGPIEERGRLNYIDGCTDSLLIAPIIKGDPCLNLLYFPQGIDQTPHTHPSNRVGMVARGYGECITPTETIPLFPGQIFIIHADGKHSFRTEKSDMTVIAYHPDSDFGATHDFHPMINRTIVDGVSASLLDDIKTR